MEPKKYIFNEEDNIYEIWQVMAMLSLLCHCQEVNGEHFESIQYKTLFLLICSEEVKNIKLIPHFN